MKLVRHITLGILGLCIVIAILAGYNALKMKSQVKELFKLNKTLKAEGYFMTGFEFQLVGMGYYIDKHQYRKAQTKLSDYYTKLRNREGLVKIPEFKNNQEEIDFYLDLQNPRTGAFIDESAPFCVYYEATKNVIEHLVSLSDSTTAPLKLHYPLTFLDSINTPENLIGHLNDISYVGWLASHFPQTTFHFARNILDATSADNALEAHNLYTFSPEWKHTMLKWMYDFQDTTSGMWGPKNKRTGELRKYDLNNTKSIVKSFRDKQGNNLYEEFPLKYGDKLFKSSLEQLSEPYPDEDDLAEIHEWNLRQAKGFSMLLRYLWNDASTGDKKNAEQMIARNIDICFKNYYVAAEGAFSYYPNSEKASPDGITNLIFDEIGAFSYKKQKKFWGAPEANIKDMGEVILHNMHTSDLSPVLNIPDVNSLRIYNCNPDYENLTDSVWAVFYPKDTSVLDVMEIVPNVLHWAETSSLSMGNWTSMARLKKTYSNFNIKKPVILRKELPVKEINEKLTESSELYFIGFDKLQIPRYCIGYKILK
ncbi:hypothetical protein [Maribellus maritimus]|uniref:hypothetical protein n=1 Tax=Maribellus maritimus TaxID=2870838 RepID=UPI001EEB2B62|nr:hypothetical protein [Maribellus maritimus]MCG6186293.1 hypothetical protein [Maribellus maritimus]